MFQEITNIDEKELAANCIFHDNEYEHDYVLLFSSSENQYCLCAVTEDLTPYPNEIWSTDFNYTLDSTLAEVKNDLDIFIHMFSARLLTASEFQHLKEFRVNKIEPIQKKCKEMIAYIEIIHENVLNGKSGYENIDILEEADRLGFDSHLFFTAYYFYAEGKQ